MVEKKSKTKKTNVDKKESEIVSLTGSLQLLQADFENYRKRSEREKGEFAKFACSNIINELLPIVDNFELAMKHTKNTDEFIKGIELVFANLVDTLSKEGLKSIDSLGEKFDPNLHEAMIQEKSKKEEGTILEVFQKGYFLNGKVLRPSKVKVAGR